MSIHSTMEYISVEYKNSEDIFNVFADYFRISVPRNSTPLQITINSTSSLPKQTLSLIKGEEVVESIRWIKANITTGLDDNQAFLISDCQFVLA